jgi:hypothetical protein
LLSSFPGLSKLFSCLRLSLLLHLYYCCLYLCLKIHDYWIFSFLKGGRKSTCDAAWSDAYIASGQHCWKFMQQLPHHVSAIEDHKVILKAQESSPWNGERDQCHNLLGAFQKHAVF